MPIFNAIAACNEQGVIGVDGKIPWHLPLDFKWFKRNTLHRTIVMGRGTFDSMGGKPLPNRKTIILTRNKQLKVPEGVELCFDREELKDRSEEVIWVCGGEQVYWHMLHRCRHVYLTRVKSKNQIYGINFARFPMYLLEEDFVYEGKVFENDDMKICRYVNKEDLVKNLSYEWPF